MSLDFFKRKINMAGLPVIAIEEFTEISPAALVALNATSAD